MWWSIYFFKLFPPHNIILKDFWASIKLLQNAYPSAPPLTQYFTACQNWKSFDNVGFGNNLVGSRFLFHLIIGRLFWYITCAMYDQEILERLVNTGATCDTGKKSLLLNQHFFDNRAIFALIGREQWSISVKAMEMTRWWHNLFFPAFSLARFFQ